MASCGYLTDQRVIRSFPEMERVARATVPDDRMRARPQRIGEVEFQNVHREGDRVYFEVGGNGVDPYGYVWSPGRVPVDDSNPAVASTFRHMQGPWYRWSDSY
ncbi:hypothetical protein DP939_00845 [Spongiactinospora rosea]|uniref:Uncharacterized protein n=1 Tax=Spongiactinospora rosea TaxID=2248750 RepID=A0A366M6T1_9ACTN|nr:hypothetical protein DP939_00845 [Spongiactinospora rosea]